MELLSLIYPQIIMSFLLVFTMCFFSLLIFSHITSNKTRGLVSSFTKLILTIKEIGSNRELIGVNNNQKEN